MTMEAGEILRPNWTFCKRQLLCHDVDNAITYANVTLMDLYPLSWVCTLSSRATLPAPPSLSWASFVSDVSFPHTKQRGDHKAENHTLIVAKSSLRIPCGFLADFKGFLYLWPEFPFTVRTQLELILWFGQLLLGWTSLGLLSEE